MRRLSFALLFAVLMVTAARAQDFTLIFCALDDALDFKIVKTGDTVALHTTRDLVQAGTVLLPRGTQVTARVVAADANSVSVVLNNASLKTGKVVALMGIVAAVAISNNEDLSDDPIYALNNSRTATAQHTQGPSSRDAMSSTSMASSRPEVQTAMIKGGSAPKTALSANSEGALGIEGLTLEWIVDKPPATTVLRSKKKNLKIRKGAEVLLRTVPLEL